MQSLNCCIINPMKTSPNSFMQELVSDFVRSKRSNYSEECISYYLDQARFSIEDIGPVHNAHGERLKCSLVTHRPQAVSSCSDNLHCVVFLHGLGSSRLQALAIIPHLPRNYCLCMFDLSGSGKSQGNIITYGPKEKEDIEPVLKHLNERHALSSFVIWGRSMGAVATLLYGTSLESINENTQISAMVKCMVLDSPFSNFKEISRQIALTRMSIPSFIADLALRYVEDAFDNLLTDKQTEQNYSPFRIDFNRELSSPIPAIFLYSEKDEIVPHSHSENIIRHYKSRFEKVVIPDCSHNESRPTYVLEALFAIIDKFGRGEKQHRHRLQQSLTKEHLRDSLSNKSLEKRRGIVVYTPSQDSKEQRRSSITKIGLKCARNFYATIGNEECENIHRTEEQSDMTSFMSHATLASSENKLGSCCLTRPNSHKTQQPKSPKKLIKPKYPESSQPVKSLQRKPGRQMLNTIDIDTNGLISKKLLITKEQSKVYRPRRFNLQRRKDLKLTHERYLE